MTGHNVLYAQAKAKKRWHSSSLLRTLCTVVLHLQQDPEEIDPVLHSDAQVISPSPQARIIAALLRCSEIAAVYSNPHWQRVVLQFNSAMFGKRIEVSIYNSSSHRHAYLQTSANGRPMERGVKKRGRSSLCSFPNDAVPAFPPLCTSLPKLPVDDLTLSPYLSPTPRRPIRSLHAHTPRQILLHHHKHRRGVHRISPPSSNLLPRLPTFLAAIRKS